jgi:hypothetical protein
LRSRLVVSPPSPPPPPCRLPSPILGEEGDEKAEERGQASGTAGGTLALHRLFTASERAATPPPAADAVPAAGVGLTSFMPSPLPPPAHVHPLFLPPPQSAHCCRCAKRVILGGGLVDVDGCLRPQRGYNCVYCTRLNHRCPPVRLSCFLLFALPC